MNDSLKTIVAELLAVAPDQVGTDRVLAGARLQGSLGRSILDAAIRRRMGVQSKACYTAKTFGELEAAINGSATAPAINGTPVAASVEPIAAVKAEVPMFTGTTQSSACGVDIELIESLPVTSDFWSHEFYTTNFTPGEIAYCLTQQSPALHFAARWCAKEALKKCEPALMPEQMRNIEVISNTDGTPSIRHLTNGSSANLPHALSLSHTHHAAVAVVVRVATPPPPAPAPTVLSMPPMPAPPPPPPRMLGFVTFLCSLAALLLATIALWQAVHHH